MQRGRRRGAGGMSLIELMVGVALLAILLALAVPAFGDWMRNARVRTTAESLRAGLQQARAEAIRRNANVRFQLVTTLDNGCALSTSGPFWVSNAGASVSPASGCAGAISTTVSPFLIQKSPVVSNATSDITLTASGSGVIAFDPLGRMTGTTNPTIATPAQFTVDLGSSGGSCIAQGGNVRCLRIAVSVSGDARLCDLTRTTTNDPMKC
ncbi:GspH/FimT family pseudopilin [Pseudacidovorax intermedius]|uniref:Type II secretion system protein H n=1 Tax=Pseudacidovorax intermedius TaxID=433924 RepID=A0A370FJJ0_9BURK|nr:GspH/FimT family pseudopilin [Pseudacidovorax intermedius]RDI25289.1 type IV fimbrial biogenesis protein FimT [Pseudacidovorax intermedius]